MKKIPTLFVRDTKTFRATDQMADGCDWVANGDGVATRKWDGTCCMVKSGKLFKRYDGSKSKFLPDDFVPAEGAETHWLGWRPVGPGPEDRWFRDAPVPDVDGTYELIGPKVNQNPDGSESHVFKKHGDVVYLDAPRTFDGIRDWFVGKDIEGVVFHNPDGRMAKIKLKDFGVKRARK